MRKSYSFIFLLICSTLAIAQKDPFKFGDIPMADMKMTQYEFDSSASAVILLDYGEAELQRYVRHVRIKILNKKGFNHADIRILLQPYLRLTRVKAASYNLEGDKLVTNEMSDDAIFKNNLTRGLDMQTFTIPNVREGSVIEYSYSYISSSGMSPPTWEFQKTIPVRLSEYWATIPEALEYRKYIQGYVQDIMYKQGPRQMTGYQAIAHHWLAKDVPAFHDEPFMAGESNYLSRIIFALAGVSSRRNGFTELVEILPTWASIGKLDDNFTRSISTFEFSSDELANVIKGQDSAKTVAAIHSFIRDQMKWNKKSTLGLGGSNLKKAWQTKTGSSADINLLMASLLKGAGFNVKMILYSTREHGHIRKENPMVTQFNDVACCIQLLGRKIVLDATEKYLPYTSLPQRCLNGQGLLVANKIEWIELDSNTKSKTTTNADLVLDASGELQGRVTLIYAGYKANTMRTDFFEKGEEKYKSDFMTNKDWQTDKIEFQNLKEFEHSPSLKYDLLTSANSSVANDLIYINPFVLSQEKSNPFVDTKREYPVDFGNAIQNLYLYKMEIPSGYVVEELPESLIFALPSNDARYVYSMTTIGNTLNLTRDFQINKKIFTQDEYPVLREFYDNVVSKETEQIVLRKKQ